MHNYTYSRNYWNCLANNNKRTRHQVHVISLIPSVQHISTKMGKKPVKDIEKRSERLSAYDQLCFLIETYQRVTHPFGFDIYRDDYKLNWALFYSFFVTISYTTNCVYWAVIAALNNNLDEVLKSVSCIPASFQVSSKQRESGAFLPSDHKSCCNDPILRKSFLVCSSLI